MIAPRDTPEEVDRLHAAGAVRDVELDGHGIWRHPEHPGERWHGAQNALAALHGLPLPYPLDGGIPWAA